MKRNYPPLFILFVVALLVMPSAVMAQEATPTLRMSTGDYLPSAEDLGEGWAGVLSTSNPAIPSEFPAFGQYLGEHGSIIQIQILPLGIPLQQRLDGWERASSYWQGYADFFAGGEAVSTSAFAEIPLPKGVEMALRFEGETQIFNQEICVGLYAIQDGPAALVAVQGEYRGMAKVAACDNVAKLISTDGW